MTIEVLPGRYFFAQWYHEYRTDSGVVGDMMCTLYKDKNATEYELRGRIRMYADGLAHDSEDVKHWFSKRQGFATDAEAEAFAQDVVKGLAGGDEGVKLPSGYRVGCSMRTPIRSADFATIIRIITKCTPSDRDSPGGRAN